MRSDAIGSQGRVFQAASRWSGKRFPALLDKSTTDLARVLLPFQRTGRANFGMERIRKELAKIRPELQASVLAVLQTLMQLGQPAQHYHALLAELLTQRSAAVDAARRKRA